MDNLLEKQIHLENTLTPHQLKYIHSRSIRNFLNYLPYINSNYLKNEIINDLNNYFEEVENMNYTFTRRESGELSIKYLKKIGKIYKLQFNFHTSIPPKYAFFVGIDIDFLLLLFGILKELYFMPIATILLVAYSMFLKIFYKGRLWGYWY
jgi:hypothetical protein